MMGFGETVVALAGIGMVTAIVTTPLKMAARRDKYKALLGTGEIARVTSDVESMQAEMVKMRDRIAVLEKLATSEDRRLAEEIERLRPRPSAQASG